MTAQRPRWITWAFADRRTGHIVVVQLPNVPLWVFFAATVSGWIVRRPSSVHTAIHIAGDAGLALWALLEIASGVNPFRRALGVVVLAGQLVSILHSLH